MSRSQLFFALALMGLMALAVAEVGMQTLHPAQFGRDILVSRFSQTSIA